MLEKTMLDYFCRTKFSSSNDILVTFAENIFGASFVGHKFASPQFLSDNGLKIVKRACKFREQTSKDAYI